MYSWCHYILCFLLSHCYVMCIFSCFFFKQKTAYEMRISDWSSDVCSSDLRVGVDHPLQLRKRGAEVDANAGQRDIDDGRVHRHHQQAHAADREDRKSVV